MKRWRYVGRGLKLLAEGILLALVVLLVLPQALGIRPLVVLSGSMEPECPVGSVVYVKSVPQESLQKGQIITYELTEGVLVTHRIVRISQGKLYTRGDANEAEDGAPVAFGQILGKVLFCIPALGFLASALESTVGKGMLLTMAALLLLMPEGKKYRYSGGET